jgi:hypothetical protein
MLIQGDKRLLRKPIKRELKSFRGAVKTKGPVSFAEERANAKTAVAERAKEECNLLRPEQDRAVKHC